MHTFTKNKDGVTSLDQGVAPQLVYRYFLEDMVEKARFGKPLVCGGVWGRKKMKKRAKNVTFIHFIRDI